MIPGASQSTTYKAQWAAYMIPKTEDPLYTASLEAPVNGVALQSSPALIVAEKYDLAAADGKYPRNAHKAWLLYPGSAFFQAT